MRSVQRPTLGTCTRGSSAWEWICLCGVLLLGAGSLVAGLPGEIEPAVQNLFCQIRHFGNAAESCGAEDTHGGSDHALLSRPTVASPLPNSSSNPHRAPKLPSGGKLATLASSLLRPDEQPVRWFDEETDLGARLAVLNDSSFGDGTGTYQVAQALPQSPPSPASEPESRTGPQTRTGQPLRVIEPTGTGTTSNSGAPGTHPPPERTNAGETTWQKARSVLGWFNRLLIAGFLVSWVLPEHAEPDPAKGDITLDDDNRLHIAWLPPAWPRPAEIRLATVHDGERFEEFVPVVEENGVQIAQRTDGTRVASKTENQEFGSVYVGSLPEELERMIRAIEPMTAEDLEQYGLPMIPGKRHIKIGKGIYFFDPQTGELRLVAIVGSSPIDPNTAVMSNGGGGGGSSPGPTDDDDGNNEDEVADRMLGDQFWRDTDEEGRRTYHGPLKSAIASYDRLVVMEHVRTSSGVETTRFAQSQPTIHQFNIQLDVHATGESGVTHADVFIDRKAPPKKDEVWDVMRVVLHEVSQLPDQVEVELSGIRDGADGEFVELGYANKILSALGGYGGSWRADWRWSQRELENETRLGLTVRARQQDASDADDRTVDLGTATANDFYRLAQIRYEAAERIVQRIAEELEAGRTLHSILQLAPLGVNKSQLSRISRSPLRFVRPLPAVVHNLADMQVDHVRAIEPALSEEEAQGLIDQVRTRQKAEEPPYRSLADLYVDMVTWQSARLARALATLERGGVRVGGERDLIHFVTPDFFRAGLARDYIVGADGSVQRDGVALDLSPEQQRVVGALVRAHAQGEPYLFQDEIALDAGGGAALLELAERDAQGLIDHQVRYVDGSLRSIVRLYGFAGSSFSRITSADTPEGGTAEASVTSTTADLEDGADDDQGDDSNESHSADILISDANPNPDEIAATVGDALDDRSSVPDLGTVTVSSIRFRSSSEFLMRQLALAVVDAFSTHEGSWRAQWDVVPGAHVHAPFDLVIRISNDAGVSVPAGTFRDLTTLDADELSQQFGIALDAAAEIGEYVGNAHDADDLTLVELGALERVTPSVMRALVEGAAGFPRASPPRVENYLSRMTAAEVRSVAPVLTDKEASRLIKWAQRGVVFGEPPRDLAEYWVERGPANRETRAGLAHALAALERAGVRLEGDPRTRPIQPDPTVGAIPEDSLVGADEQQWQEAYDAAPETLGGWPASVREEVTEAGLHGTVTPNGFYYVDGHKHQMSFEDWERLEQLRARRFMPEDDAATGADAMTATALGLSFRHLGRFRDAHEAFVEVVQKVGYFFRDPLGEERVTAGPSNAYSVHQYGAVVGPDGLAKLTPRERQVVRLVLDETGPSKPTVSSRELATIGPAMRQVVGAIEKKVPGLLVVTKLSEKRFLYSFANPLPIRQPSEQGSP